MPADLPHIHRWAQTKGTWPKQRGRESFPGTFASGPKQRGRESFPGTFASGGQTKGDKQKVPATVRVTRPTTLPLTPTHPLHLNSNAPSAPPTHPAPPYFIPNARPIPISTQIPHDTTTIGHSFPRPTL